MRVNGRIRRRVQQAAGKGTSKINLAWRFRDNRIIQKSSASPSPPKGRRTVLLSPHPNQTSAFAARSRNAQLTISERGFTGTVCLAFRDANTRRYPSAGRLIALNKHERAKRARPLRRNGRRADRSHLRKCATLSEPSTREKERERERGR
jgi:hypothetical protein